VRRSFEAICHKTPVGTAGRCKLRGLSSTHNGREAKGNQRCGGFRPSRSQARRRSQRFQFVFAFKETSGRPEVPQRLIGEKRNERMNKPPSCTRRRRSSVLSESQII